MEYSSKILLDMLGQARGKRILVIGDSIIDETTHLSSIGTDLETKATPKRRHIRTEYSFGGASNLTRNLLELGADVQFITLLGNDHYGNLYKDFIHSNLIFRPIIEEGRTTTAKRRFWVGDKKEYQIDHLDERDISEESADMLIDKLSSRTISNNPDLVIISDYRHGMLTPRLIEGIMSYASKKGIKTIAASQLSQKPSNLADYAGVHTLVINKDEASAVYPITGPFVFFDDMQRLSRALKSNICMTMGDKGATMYLRDIMYSDENTLKTEARDTCGAGDCFLAALAVSDFENHPAESLYLANCWAGLKVGNIGTATPKREDLIKLIQEKS